MLYAAGIIHVILFVFYMILRYITGLYEYMCVFTAAIIPVLGPLTGIILIYDSFRERDRDYEKNFAAVSGVSNPVYDFRLMTGDFVSAEEVFIVNSNQDRRKIMLDILRRDAKPYLDVLKLAVSNDDAETSHYATATIMQIQTDYQNEIARCFAASGEPDATVDDVRDYISSLLKYINSRLLDENLLVRQRLALKSAIEVIRQKYGCRDYDTDYAENLMCMGDREGALEVLQPLLDEEYPSEDVILLRIRLFVAAHDRKGLDDFIKHIRTRRITLTPAIQEEFSFWNEQTDQCNG